MRGNFLLMLTLSLALHVGVAAGFAFTYFHGSAPVASASSPMSESPIMLLHSMESPEREFQPSRAIKAVDQPLAVASPVVAPARAQAKVEKTLSLVTQPPALASETNPNPHIQALPPEAVLSPTPAPRLNNADGIVFILDVSGSMYEPYAGATRLAIARQALSRQIRALKDGTPFAITFYAQHACNSGPLVAANDTTREAAVRYLMRDVDCGGGTNLPAGLASARQLHPGTLVLASDGDLNISAFNLAAKARDILGPAGHGPVLSVIGIAPRSSQGADRLLQGLADQQGGSYADEQATDSSELVTSAANVKPASSTP